MLNEYLTRGYLIFRNIIPATLLADLRRQADIARDLAHELNGPQAQRIQPLEKFGEKIALRPFRDYVELPALKTAIEELLGPGYTHGHVHIMGLLVEPLDHPWHCGWHRDGVVEVPIAARTGEVRDALDQFWHDLRVFNQVNCALYADSCTWYVPGSHLRSFDLPDEQQSSDDPRMRKPPQELSNVEAEVFYIEHCRQMPGAVQVHLNAGDFMIYRNLAWHTGLYLPYRPRATIHDIVSHLEGDKITEVWRRAQKKARAALEKTREQP